MRAGQRWGTESLHVCFAACDSSKWKFMFGNACNLLALCVKWSLAEETKGKVGIFGRSHGRSFAGKFFPGLSEWRNGEVPNYFYEFWPWIPMLNCNMYCILTWIEHAWSDYWRKMCIWLTVVRKIFSQHGREKGVEHLTSFPSNFS